MRDDSLSSSLGAAERRGGGNVSYLVVGVARRAIGRTGRAVALAARRKRGWRIIAVGSFGELAPGRLVVPLWEGTGEKANRGVVCGGLSACGVERLSESFLEMMGRWMLEAQRRELTN